MNDHANMNGVSRPNLLILFQYESQNGAWRPNLDVHFDTAPLIRLKTTNSRWLKSQDKEKTKAKTENRKKEKRFNLTSAPLDFVPGERNYLVCVEQVGLTLFTW